MAKKARKSRASKKQDVSAVSEDPTRDVSEVAQDQRETASQAGLDAEDKAPGVAEQERSVAEAAAEEAERDEQEAAEVATVPAADLEKLKTEKEEYYDRLLRLKAEFENYRKRVQRESESFRKYAAEDVIWELLPVLDNFERALTNVPEGVNDGFRQGIEIIHKQLLEALKKVGLSPMEPVGKRFDPNFHEALTGVKSEDHDEGTVVEEFLKGYTLFDKVVRHAKVSVSSGKDEEADIRNELEEGV